MTLMQTHAGREWKGAGSRVGYAIAVVVNLALLVIVWNVRDWGLAPFLTEEFSDVLAWMSASLLLSIAVNLFYQFDDRPEVKWLGQVLIGLVSIAVTYRILTVFPFDFSRYDFAWDTVTRILLVLAIVGAGIGVLAETIRLFGGYRDQKEKGGEE